MIAILCHDVYIQIHNGITKKMTSSKVIWINLNHSKEHSALVIFLLAKNRLKAKNIWVITDLGKNSMFSCQTWCQLFLAQWLTVANFSLVFFIITVISIEINDFFCLDRICVAKSPVSKKIMSPPWHFFKNSKKNTVTHKLNSQPPVWMAFNVSGLLSPDFWTQTRKNLVKFQPWCETLCSAAPCCSRGDKNSNHPQIYLLQVELIGAPRLRGAHSIAVDGAQTNC